MATKGPDVDRIGASQIFDCESVPIPPGTKSCAKLQRGSEDGSPSRPWLLLGATAVAALLIGAAIGRYCLP